MSVRDESVRGENVGALGYTHKHLFNVFHLVFVSRRRKHRVVLVM